VVGIPVPPLYTIEITMNWRRKNTIDTIRPKRALVKKTLMKMLWKMSVMQNNQYTSQMTMMLVLGSTVYLSNMEDNMEMVV
jgi:hypothetical protein